jgi:hypothetical protein
VAGVEASMRMAKNAGITRRPTAIERGKNLIAR